MSDNPFVGHWTYRSLLNDPDVNTAFNNLEFGRGTIDIADGPMQLLTGTIGGEATGLASRSTSCGAEGSAVGSRKISIWPPAKPASSDAFWKNF